MLTLVACPECASPAEITDRFVLPSTAGPVGHVVLDCAAGHHFRMASDRLPVGAPAAAAIGSTSSFPKSQATHVMLYACTAAAKRVRKVGLAWLRIYGGPEIAGLLAAALAFALVRASGGPLLESALLGSWAEDVAFVSYFAVRAVREESRRHGRHHWMKYYLLIFGLAFWTLIIELGPAEAADKFVRPALLYEIPRSLHNIAAGFILAKLAADIFYYLLAYAGRLARERYFSPRAAPAVRHPASKPAGGRAIAALKTIAGAGHSHSLKVI